MKEIRTQTLLKAETKSVMLDTELRALREQLEDIERKLIPLLLTVQRALGKEPTLLTRANTLKK